MPLAVSAIPPSVAGSLDTYVALPHLLVSPSGRPGSIVDKALSKLGRRRRVAVVVPHFLAALPIVRQSDVVVHILGRRLALASRDGLRIHAPPLELPGFGVSLFLARARSTAIRLTLWFSPSRSERRESDMNWRSAPVDARPVFTLPAGPSPGTWT